MLTGDGGTVKIYEKYTGLVVKDRWQGIGSLLDLMIPFGSPTHSSAAQYSLLREKGESGANAFLGIKKVRGTDDRLTGTTLVDCCSGLLLPAAGLTPLLTASVGGL